MGQVCVTQQNWAGGELSPSARGRFDLPIFKNSAERIVNFFVENAGPFRFREGSRFVNPTRRNNIGCLIPFQFNDEQAYLLELTEGYMRFHTDGGILVQASKNIGGATKTNPVVVTAASHGYSNGDEILISGVVGMTELNGRNFVIQNQTTDTFTLYATDGVTPIDGTAYTTYVSGGIAEKIFELTTPYSEDDIFQIKYGQNADVQYQVHDHYLPRKLTRTGALSWSLATFTRTADPFTDPQTITNITQANPANVTSTGHALITGDEIVIEGVVGMTQLNGRRFLVTKTGADNFTLQDLDGVNVDSSGYTAYGSDGYATLRELLPRAFAFYQGRAYYGGSGAFPQSVWGSKPLDDDGDPQYDDLTVGTAPTDALKFTLSPITGKVDKVQSLIPTFNFLAIATSEGITKLTGGTEGTAISPSAIDASPLVSQGVLREISPILLGSGLMYVDRSGLNTSNLEFNVVTDAFDADDRNLINEHLTESGIKQMVYCIGRPSMFLQVRNDGVLVGLTTQLKENINGGHRHIFGGEDSKIISSGVMPRINKQDQMWFIVERTIGGQTVRYVEYLEDDQVYPEKDDEFTDALAEEEDTIRWRNKMFEAQKHYLYMDSALTYDGSELFSATMTPGAVSGNSVTFTASSGIFTASMVGRQIWKRSSTGDETGRAEILEYTSSTQVVCRILTAFDAITAMAAGDWFLTTNEVSGLWHLEGQEVVIVTDGGDHAVRTVALGKISLDYQASVVHVGLNYIGFVRSINIEGGGQNGPAQTKPKNINQIGIKFSNTLGAKFGKSLYNMDRVEFRSPGDYTGRPPPLFSGIKVLPYEDDTDEEKHVYIVQDKPLPCKVLLISAQMETDDG